jgi:hypothetical protein
MRTLATGLLGLLLAAAGMADEKKEVYKVTADEIAKEFKDDPGAAKKKYAAAGIQLTGTATLAIGSGKDTEVMVENGSKIPIRLGTDKRPANFPAKFMATAAYKDFFAPAKELSLTASKLTYAK